MDLDAEYLKIRNLSNKGRHRQAYLKTISLLKKNPTDPRLLYCEAVLYGDDERGRAPAEIRARHRVSAAKLRRLLRRIRAFPKPLRRGLRNEYYWFSHQPRKQYALGKEVEKKEPRAGCYSQGVGAAELAVEFWQAGKRGVALKWARRSEAAWVKFYKLDPHWYNGYIFYAKALGIQNRLAEMEQKLKIAARISGQSVRCEEFQKVRKQIRALLKIRR